VILHEASKAFSSEVDTGSREENATKQKTQHSPAMWRPVRVENTTMEGKPEHEPLWQKQVML